MTEQEADEKYAARIMNPAQAIVEQNELLIARARESDFKQVFARRDRFFAALRELHEAYVRQLIASSAKPVRHHRKRRVEVDSRKAKRASDRAPGNGRLYP